MAFQTLVVVVHMGPVLLNCFGSLCLERGFDCTSTRATRHGKAAKSNERVFSLIFLSLFSLHGRRTQAIIEGMVDCVSRKDIGHLMQLS